MIYGWSGTEFLTLFVEGATTVPILFIHGVSVRDESGWQQIEVLLRSYVAPQLASDPENVKIIHCFWGLQAASLSWLGSSVPDSPAAAALKASVRRVRDGRKKLAAVSKKAFKNPRFMHKGTTNKSSEFKPKPSRLKSLPKESLSNYCTAAIMENESFSPTEQALLAVAADQVAHSDEVIADLNQCNSIEEETAVLQSRVKTRFEALKQGYVDRKEKYVDMTVNVAEKLSPRNVMQDVSEKLKARKQKYQDFKQEVVDKIQQDVERYQDFKHDVKEKLTLDNIKHGVGEHLAHQANWAHRFGVDLKEHMTRAMYSPTFAATRVALEMRNPLNRFVSRFLGDVFTYLHRRGNSAKPGPIPKTVMEQLAACRENQKERNGEALVVLSHSMGGQLVYDMVTHFLPNTPEMENVRIDFWCASASQVGFFEELKLFLESSPEYGADTGALVPYPDKKHLGYWWNVWDHNDFVSYSVKGVVDGVDDQFYNTGMDIVQAHVGYLVLPSFYRLFAAKIAAAQKNGFAAPLTRST